MAYRRLPGKRRTLTGTSALYVGTDHFLQVHSTRLTEEYRRYYFQDVLAITIQIKAPFHFWWAGAIVLFALASTRYSRGFGWPAGILAAGVVFLWLRGPSCSVHLQTAIGRARIPSLHRLKTAERVAPMLQETIESVQGSVVAMPEVASSMGPPPLKRSVPADRPAAPIVVRRSADHMLLFGFLTLEAALAGIWLATRMTSLDRVMGVATLIEFLLLVLVMVRQTRRPVTDALRKATLAATGRWLLIQGIGTAIAYKAVLIDKTARAIDPLMASSGWHGQLNFISLLATGLAGLWLSFRSTSE